MNELQVAVMHWEMTLFQHESKFSEVVADSVKTAAMRAMLPKDILERFLDGPFHYEKLRNRVSAYVDKMQAVEVNPLTSGRLTYPKERTKVSMQCNSAVCMIGPTRNTSKSPTMSENPSTVGLPIRHHQHHANRLHETRNPGMMRRTKQSAGKKKCLICCTCGGKGHPARLCPSGDDCQHVDEVGTEPSSYADSDLFGLDWGDDPLRPSTQ